MKQEKKDAKPAGLIMDGECSLDRLIDDHMTFTAESMKKKERQKNGWQNEDEKKGFGGVQ